MALDPKAVGKKTPELVHAYGWKETALYALGCGAKLRELDFLYEKRGPKVLPSYAVVPAFPACTALMTAVGGDVTGIVHGAQKITLHRPFAPEGRLVTVGRVAGIYDMKKLATCIIATETRDGEGALVAETEWQIIFRFDGNFGGERPPKTERVHVPEREPDFRVEETTAPEQALLYRLSGDINPLHADPEMAESVGFGRPILHGLCTYGYVGRAVLHQVCGSDPARLKSLSGQFRRPVWPGDTLVVEGWKEGGRVVLRALCRERPDEPVFGNAYADVD